MDKKILVTYASKYGSTAEIAERIGLKLHQSGFPVDVAPANKAVNLDDYQAVILGSAVYIGQWRKEAASFLKTYQSRLAKMPVWLFSSGPTGEGELENLLQGWRFPKGLTEIAARINPRGSVIFRGAVDPQKLNGLENWMMKKVNAPSGDFRDWQEIHTWAASIVAELVKDGQKD